MRDDSIPATWTESTARRYRDLIHEVDDGLALYDACELFSRAARMQERIDADGYVVKGSTGQPVAHPLIAEVRLYTRQALHRLISASTPARGASTSSQAGAALARRRWGMTPGTRRSSP